MIDIFIGSKKIDEHYNGARPMNSEYQKTVIVVTGNGGTGKSTICKLYKNEVYYISVDMAMINLSEQIKEMKEFVLSYGQKSIFNIHILSKIVNQTCKELFINTFFEKYINNGYSYNILLDGFIFSYEEIFDLLVEKCKKTILEFGE